MKSIQVSLCVIVCSCFARACNAELILQFGVGDTIGLTSLNVDAGESLLLDLYITQTGSTVRLNSESTSVNTVDVTFSVTGGPGVAPNDSVAFGNFFRDTSFTSRMGQALRFSAESTKIPPTPTSDVPGVISSDDGVADNSILFGTISLSTAADVSGSRTILLSGNTDSFGNLTTSPDTVLTGGLPLVSGSLTLNVSAVPEPSSLMLVGVIGMGMFTLRHRGGCRRVKIMQAGLP